MSTAAFATEAPSGKEPVVFELAAAGQDPELAAINHIMGILRALGDNGKRRVVKYVVDRLEDL
jgi:hypothetical protein